MEAFQQTAPPLAIDVSGLSDGEREELIELGAIGDDGSPQSYALPSHAGHRTPLAKEAVSASSVLNEAFAYERPSSFSRALSFEFGDVTVLLVSGTASVDERGETIHVGDFRAQCWRTYRNISKLLESAGMTWQDIVRTTCYLRDIERDYRDFNEVRTAFFGWLGLDPLPASTGIQARLCREDLLVEIEAIAVARREGS
ncbi:MAG: Rid family hydrolase [Gemmatimonadales bacterium]|jgi:enamine deaminase RidA (YjgF/YER057c/UK114 family)